MSFLTLTSPRELLTARPRPGCRDVRGAPPPVIKMKHLTFTDCHSELLVCSNQPDCAAPEAHKGEIHLHKLLHETLRNLQDFLAV